MKKLFAIAAVLILLLGFSPACESVCVIRFQLKIADPNTADYFICAEGQDEKIKLDLESCEYTEGTTGALSFRIYDVTVKYPVEVTVREDGRSFWTIYMGYTAGEEETYSYSLKNIGIRSEHTTVDMIGGGKVLYDTIKTIYNSEDFTLYADEGMERSGEGMFSDTQFIWYEKDGTRLDCGSVLTAATIKLLGKNAPYSSGNVETWFSVISDAEGVGEIDRFCVTTKMQEPQPECTLTTADLPDVVSEKGAKWLDAAEFTAAGIKPDTDVAAMKAAFGEPVSSWGEYEQTLNYMVYQYDGVIYTFRTGILDEGGWEEQAITYSAKFTKNLIKFPRGIQIGNSFEEVLERFPLEMDYKANSDGLFYGDYWGYWGEGRLGYGTVQIRNNDGFDNGVWIFVTSEEYWPMLYIHFNGNLTADKITVQFSPYPYG